MTHDKPEKVVFPNGKSYNIHHRGKYDIQPGDMIPFDVGDTVVSFHVAKVRIGMVTKVSDEKIEVEYQCGGPLAGIHYRQTYGRERLLFNIIPSDEDLSSIDADDDLTWRGDKGPAGGDWPLAWIGVV